VLHRQQHHAAGPSQHRPDADGVARGPQTRAGEPDRPAGVGHVDGQRLLGRTRVVELLQPRRGASAPAHGVHDEIGGQRLLGAPRSPPHDPHAGDPPACVVGDEPHHVAAQHGAHSVGGEHAAAQVLLEEGAGRLQRGDADRHRAQVVPGDAHPVAGQRPRRHRPGRLHLAGEAGKSSSSSRAPPGIRVCACRPCGTPRRDVPGWGSGSRSTTVTRSKNPVSTLAAISPATPPPSTTASPFRTSRTSTSPCAFRITSGVTHGRSLRCPPDRPSAVHPLSRLVGPGRGQQPPYTSRSHIHSTMRATARSRWRR
jgi:hypothetical protein